jgi:superfamily II DNA helicase RecQ
MPESIEAVLRRYWGFGQFLPLQKQAMECVCRGRDSIVVLPTGGGKSLCFQAPALILPQLTLVISPLIALMKDQIDSLLDSGVPAGRLDSTMSHPERNEMYNRLRARKLKFLYVSPERLLMQESIEAVLRKYWGFDHFLALQKQAMECVCQGRDSIVVLPTGGGKSLCFQAPALVLPQLTLVISPLISLMKDQIDSLLDSGAPAGRLDSTMSHPERN